MHRAVARTALAVVGVTAAVAVGSVIATPALAEEPFRLDDDITDRAGVLGDRSDEVQDAIDQLYDDHRTQLWVVYVESFDEYDSAEWADLTALESDLGLNAVLLAVATVDRSYAVSIDP